MQVSTTQKSNCVLPSSSAKARAKSGSCAFWALRSAKPPFTRTGKLVGEFGGEVGANESHYFDFHPTEPWLLVASPPQRIRVYTLSIGEFVTIATSRLTRGLTDAECVQYPGACPP